MGESSTPFYSVDELAPELATGVLKGLRVAPLHGRMPSELKDSTMQAFSDKKIDVLISTTVIEVGVDVPNATVMVIMDADRFGVSQLHQLRGRVGRGTSPGLCLLVTKVESESLTMERLLAVAGTTDGFELSKIDLEQRREGDVLGTSQSGAKSHLRLLQVVRDEKLIESARSDAAQILERDINQYPNLLQMLTELEDEESSRFIEKS
jgi:ATP-dependent DNA helicase RecG